MRSPIVIGPHSYRQAAVARYATLGLRAVGARGRIDGVEVHWLFPTGIIGLLVARLRRVPLVLVAHGDDVMVTPWRSDVFKWVASRLCAWADAVVTNSEETASYVARLGGDPVLIHPAVDLDKFHPTPRPNTGRTLYLGGSREGKRKGLDIARGLADTLAGPGLVELAPDAVPALIAEHDVVLVPSRSEAYGLVAAEAIASGRWVVASAVGGLLEIVTDGVNGTLVKDGDFAGALARVPDYDPFTIAATAAAFDRRAEAAAFDRLWERVTTMRRANSIS